MPTDLSTNLLNCLNDCRVAALSGSGQSKLHYQMAARLMDRALNEIAVAEDWEGEGFAPAPLTLEAGVDALLAPIGTALNSAMDQACDEMLARLNGEVEP